MNDLISARIKWGLWFGVWAVVAFVSMVPNPSQILMAPFFPLGLVALLPRGDERAISGWMQLSPCLLGWLFYYFLSVALFRLRRKDAFLLFYVVFCLVLALNVVGCKKTLAAVAGIH